MYKNKSKKLQEFYYFFHHARMLYPFKNNKIKLFKHIHFTNKILSYFPISQSRKKHIKILTKKSLFYTHFQTTFLYFFFSLAKYKPYYLLFRRFFAQEIKKNFFSFFYYFFNELYAQKNHNFPNISVQKKSLKNNKLHSIFTL